MATVFRIKHALGKTRAEGRRAGRGEFLPWGGVHGLRGSGLPDQEHVGIDAPENAFGVAPYRVLHQLPARMRPDDDETGAGLLHLPSFDYFPLVANDFQLLNENTSFIAYIVQKHTKFKN
ncbi:hypothetical protein FG93_03323 [Bosea sp. LC85]|nr:hypothetical protein [Bosea sp. LC85]KFC69277.1 hypothetical protein FG93_03323 [Bosea sp. LC85]